MPGGRWSLTLAALITSCAYGQAPQFEVVSIRRSAPDARPGYTRIEPGGERYVAVAAPLRFIIQEAYHLPRKDQLVGATDWMFSELYDINAKADGPQSADVFRAMIRNLLADRFKLQFHIEAKEGPVYALVQEKGGAKLQRHDADNAGDPLTSTNSNPDPAQALKMSWHFKQVSLDEFAFMLSEVLDRPVVNKTGLPGGYDFDFAFTMPWPAGYPEGPVNGVTIDTSGPTAFDVIHGLGMRLEPQKGNVDVMRIDHAEKPSEN